jgi:hypothetical protein
LRQIRYLPGNAAEGKRRNPKHRNPDYRNPELRNLKHPKPEIRELLLPIRMILSRMQIISVTTNLKRRERRKLPPAGPLRSLPGRPEF